MSSLPTPAEFGAPARYTSWRRGQDEALLRNLTSDKRFIAHAMPTGSGKSLLALTHALTVAPGRTAMVTSTKGLQDQYSQEFSGYLQDIRGMANYTCDMGYAFAGKYEAFKITHEGREPTVAEGPCHEGRLCPLKESTCDYYARLRRSMRAPIVNTNYSYLLAMNRYAGGLGKYDTLMLDEAHEVPDELAGFMRVEIWPWETEHFGGLPRSKDQEVWAGWAGKRKEKVDRVIAEMKEQPGQSTKKWDDLARKLGMLEGMSPDWVHEDLEGGGHAWEPRWPAPYAEGALFRGVGKVVFYSATMRPKTLELLGIGKDQADFHEYESPYPAERRPFIHVPTIRLNHRTSEGEMYLLLGVVDRLIKDRADRKGIIHTVSYDRMRWLVGKSEYSHLMMWNDPRVKGKGTRDVVAEFKRAEGPAILVSPSVGTGYDFPMQECEYQIILKLPYPDTRAPVMAARCLDDPSYPAYLTMVALIQAAGRGMRSAEDQCETLVVDDNLTWFLSKNREFVPAWFWPAIKYQQRGVMPVPLPKLEGVRA